MNISITGNTGIIKTTITPEQIAKVKKLKPQLLVVKDEDGKNEIFRIDTIKRGTGTINANGAEFVTSVNGELIVSVEFGADTTIDEAKDALFGLTAAAKGYIELIEARVKEEYEGIVAGEKEFLDSIAVN